MIEVRPAAKTPTNYARRRCQRRLTQRIFSVRCESKDAVPCICQSIPDLPIVHEDEGVWNRRRLGPPSEKNEPLAWGQSRANRQPEKLREIRIIIPQQIASQVGRVLGRVDQFDKLILESVSNAIAIRVPSQA